MESLITHLRNNTFSALAQYPNYRLYFTGQLISLVGTWMQNVALAWLVLQITNSPFWLGLLGLSFALPMIVLPLMVRDFSSGSDTDLRRRPPWSPEDGDESPSAECMFGGPSLTGLTSRV